MASHLALSTRPRLILILLSLQFFGNAILVRGDVGTAISYGPPYTPTACNGDRQDQFPRDNMFAAVSQGLWDNGAACGRKYALLCLSGANRPCKEGAIDVVVVDKCPDDPCDATLLLSVKAFSAISSIPDATINVEYSQI